MYSNLTKIPKQVLHVPAMPRSQVRPEPGAPCSVSECAVTRTLNARCSPEYRSVCDLHHALRGKPEKPLHFITVCLTEPAGFRRAHPPGQTGLGAKVSTGSYLTRTPALNPAKGWPEMSQPLVLQQQSSREELQRQLPARMGLD